MHTDSVMKTLQEATLAIQDALKGLENWELSGLRDTQYNHDLVADAAALPILLGAGFGVISEESGDHEIDRETVVVIDPVDGSTNASLGLPWWGISLAALNKGGLIASIVGTSWGKSFEAVKGEGATYDGDICTPRKTTSLDHAVIGVNVRVATNPVNAYQTRQMGSIALDLCAVANGWLDGMVDLSAHGAHPWDFLGGWLVCQEAGLTVVDREGRAMGGIDGSARRKSIVGCTPELHSELVAKSRSV